MSRSRAGGLKSKQKYPQPVKQVESDNFFLKSKLKPKTYAQELYIESLRNNPITIGSGPAGSGKSYVAIYVALEKLMNNEIDKIVLTRPVVEAGENLGFLPGDFKQKLHPYLLPLFDAIEIHVGPQIAQRLIDSGKIEIAPLAFMRGRTFNNSFVMLDEAQNTTKKQMKLFLTRLGFNSQMCIDGDVTQSDLTQKELQGQEQGLSWVLRKLNGVIPDICICTFADRDIVRNPLIAKTLSYLDAPDDKFKNFANQQSYPIPAILKQQI